MTASSYADLVADYLQVRRGLGFELLTPAALLADFAAHVDRSGYQGPVSTQLAVQWALLGRSSSPAQAVRRLNAVRQFARYRVAFDPATEIPPVGLLGGLPGRQQPHIYSDAEIAALLAQARLLLPRGGLRPRTYVTYFALLVCTGLRLSEACRLRTDDVDLVEGLLTVRQSKFRKSRVVVLHPTTTQALSDYAAFRDGFSHSGSTAFFRTEAGALNTEAVQKTFSRLRQRLGWTAEGRARRPRIHDMRHTFAVRRLLAWYAEGVEVDRSMLALSTYLGHAKPSDTYWYLTGVPELMAITAQRFERFTEQRHDQVTSA